MKRAIFLFLLIVHLFPIAVEAVGTQKTIQPVKKVVCARPLKTQGRVNYFLTSFNDTAVNLGKYVPTDLVLVDTKYTKERRHYCLRSFVYEEFKKMNTALKKDTGLTLTIRSGFRSYETQGLIMENKGDLAALPGRSEHQLGTAIDIGGSVKDEYFIDSKEYAWMQKHAAKYGFVQSFKNSTIEPVDVTSEPWHWRYVGKEIAEKAVKKKGSLSSFLDILAKRNR